MRRLAALHAAVLALLVAAPAHADSLTYVNERFGTTVTFPAELFDTRLRPPDNGDGMTWTSPDGASLAVYGTNNVRDLDPAGLADEVGATPGVEITYRKVGKGWAVVSGFQDGLIFYQRFEFGADNVIHVVLIKYPKAQHARYDHASGEIAGSLGGP
ncbi:MAG: hypothetical protein AB7S80_17585 [Rhizobiaceae bacterium]